MGVLVTFNAAVTPSNQIDPEKFKGDLVAKLGAVDEATLVLVTVEDLLGLKVPNAQARRIVALIKGTAGPQQTETGSPPRRITVSNAPSASIQDLVAAYDPTQATSPAADEIKKRTSNTRCLVFNNDGLTINREATAREITALANGDAEREIVLIDNQPTRVYRIGEKPHRRAPAH